MTAAQTSVTPCRLLVVDDDEKLCRMVAQYLAPHGYHVDLAHNGPSGLEAAQSGNYDGIILDCMLPGFDGFEVLRRLRQTSQVPVIMLTGLGEEADRIVGLEIGADDYLPKTFSTRELLARLRAVLRRANREPANTEKSRAIHVGELCVDPDTRAATLAGVPLPLTPLEFDLLVALAKAAGRVQTRDQLLQSVAGRDYEIFDRSIDVHISSIRRKLGEDFRAPRYIVTFRSAGYMLRKPGQELPAL